VLLVVLIGNVHLAVVAEETHPALSLQMVQGILARDGRPTSGTVDIKFCTLCVQMPL
jgi:hypothetical protein